MASNICTLGEPVEKATTGILSQYPNAKLQRKPIFKFEKAGCRIISPLLKLITPIWTSCMVHQLTTASSLLRRWNVWTYELSGSFMVWKKINLPFPFQNYCYYKCKYQHTFSEIWTEACHFHVIILPDLSQVTNERSSSTGNAIATIGEEFSSLFRDFTYSADATS